MAEEYFLKDPEGYPFPFTCLHSSANLLPDHEPILTLSRLIFWHPRVEITTPNLAGE